MQEVESKLEQRQAQERLEFERQAYLMIPRKWNIQQSSNELFKYHQLIKGRKYKEALALKEQVEKQLALKELNASKRVQTKIDKEKEKLLAR